MPKSKKYPNAVLSEDAIARAIRELSEPGSEDATYVTIEPEDVIAAEMRRRGMDPLTAITTGLKEAAKGFLDADAYIWGRGGVEPFSPTASGARRSAAPILYANTPMYPNEAGPQTMMPQQTPMPYGEMSFQGRPIGGGARPLPATYGSMGLDAASQMEADALREKLRQLDDEKVRLDYEMGQMVRPGGGGGFDAKPMPYDFRMSNPELAGTVGYNEALAEAMKMRMASDQRMSLAEIKARGKAPKQQLLQHSQRDTLIGLRNVADDIAGTMDRWERTGQFDVGGWGYATGGMKWLGDATGGYFGGDLLSLQSEINRMAGNVRKIVDSGNMSKEDRNRLEGMLPKIGDNPQLKRDKLERALEYAMDKIRQIERQYKEFGYEDVPGPMTIDRAMRQDDLIEGDF